MKFIYSPLIALIFSTCLIVGCSKSGDQLTPPNPIDSTKIPDPDSTGEVIDSSTQDPQITQQDITVIDFSVLSPKYASSLYLGGVVKNEDLNDLAIPTVTTFDNKYRNPVTIYTNAPLDSSFVEAKYPSRGNDAHLVNNILEAGITQIGGSIFGGFEDFDSRYNSLRSYLGVNEDVNKILGLGYPDTSRLDSTKGRLFFISEVKIASIILEPPIYTPFVKMVSSDDVWTSFFGVGEPQIISSINYGIKTLIVFESTAGASKLRVALKEYLSHDSEEILSGTALNQLSEENQTILKNTLTNGCMAGKGTALPHKCLDALSDYISEISKIDKGNYLGEAISFSLNSLSDFKTYKATFTIDDYHQAIKK